MNTAPIGILDSGFGGLSIYRSIVELLPLESTVYVGDHAYIPYGQKSKKEIRGRTRKLIGFLLSKKAKLIVVACNTATIAGIEKYRVWFPDIPVIGVVPVVKTAAEQSKRHAFAVLSTSFTAGSVYQKKLIKKFAPDAKVYNLGCPNLLSFVERGVVGGSAIDTELRGLLTHAVIRSIDAVVLGCTHYPFLHDAIRAIVGKKVDILDSGGAVSRHVARILDHNRIAAVGRPTHAFFSTVRSAKHSAVASALLHKRIEVQYARV